MSDRTVKPCGPFGSEFPKVWENNREKGPRDDLRRLFLVLVPSFVSEYSPTFLFRVDKEVERREYCDIGVLRLLDLSRDE